MTGSSSPDALLSKVRDYLCQEIDDHDRDELTRLIAAAETGSDEARSDLASRFQGPLQFGTAGIRGLVGAGESRMNRLVVRRVTYGLIQCLVTRIPEARTRGIVLARDARHRSEAFQLEAAGVCAAAGVPVWWLDGPEPTPLAAFAVRELGAAAGVVVTASHNPREYNGYKAYWENGAQIVPPVDREIAREIDSAPSASEIPCKAANELDETMLRATPGVHERYLATLPWSASVSAPARSGVRIAYSALHGVGQPLIEAAMTGAGYELHTVARQSEPDPEFPTVDFPNPEEEGALDLLLELARETKADVAMANDPDADRLAAAFWEEEISDFRVLSGNELGILLADHLMRNHRPAKPLVVTTIVSSRMLRQFALAEGAHYLETLTGFKWIATESMLAEQQHGASFLFGFEEALGYAVGSAVRDKDGISAAFALAELVTECKSQNTGPLSRLSSLYETYGHFISGQRSFSLDGVEGRAQIDRAMGRLRGNTVWTLAGETVKSIWDLRNGLFLQENIAAVSHPEPTLEKLRADVLVFDLEDGGRCAVRPSGTEPKLKIYLEVVEPFSRSSRKRGQARIQRLAEALSEVSGL